MFGLQEHLVYRYIICRISPTSTLCVCARARESDKIFTNISPYVYTSFFFSFFLRKRKSQQTNDDLESRLTKLSRYQVHIKCVANYHLRSTPQRR